LGLFDAITARHLLTGVQRPSTGKYRKPGKQDLLRR
jgi:hypothetical protein